MSATGAKEIIDRIDHMIAVGRLMTVHGARDARRIELPPPTTKHVPDPTTDPRMAIHGHRSHDRAEQIGTRQVKSTITIMTACARRECPLLGVERKSISGGWKSPCSHK